MSVFLLNYSWTYARAWSVAKFVYPKHVFVLLDQISIGVYFLILQLPEFSFHPGKSFFNIVLCRHYHLVSHPTILFSYSLSSHAFVRLRRCTLATSPH